MRFAIRVHHSGDYDEVPELATVSLNANDRNALLRRRAMYLAVKAYDSDLAYLEFWDFSVDWYECLELDDDDADATADSEVVANFRGQVKGADTIMDCTRVIVNEEGVHWCGWVKHTSILCDTATIPWALLEEKK